MPGGGGGAEENGGRAKGFVRLLVIFHTNKGTIHSRMGGRQNHKKVKNKKQQQGSHIQKGVSVPTESQTDRLSRGDSYPLLGLLLGVLFVLFVPPFWLKVPGLLLVCLGCIGFARKSHWTHQWSATKQIWVGVLATIFVCAVSIPQLISQWKPEQASPPILKNSSSVEQTPPPRPSSSPQSSIAVHQEGKRNAIANKMVAVFAQYRPSKLPISVPPFYLDHVLLLNPDWPLGTLEDMPNPRNAEGIWPSSELMSTAKTHAELEVNCQLLNSSDIQILGMTLVFDVTFSDSGSAKTDRKVKAEVREVHIPPLAPQGKFTFHIVNQSNMFISIKFPQTAKVKLLGEEKERAIPLNNSQTNMFDRLGSWDFFRARLCGMEHQLVLL
jgi:hypothetical protein